PGMLLFRVAARLYLPCRAFSSFRFASTPHATSSTLFPYTTLFRSHPTIGRERQRRAPLGDDFSRIAADQHPFASLPLDLDHIERDRKSTRLNSSHGSISYAVFCLKKKKKKKQHRTQQKRHQHNQSP